MHQPIRNAKAFARYNSYEMLAKKLVEESDDRQRSPRSIASKIGALDKGETTWWRNHPRDAHILAGLLEIPFADLGLHGEKDTHHFDFPGFPELRPLDLRREGPFALGKARLDARQRHPKFSEDSLDEWLDPSPLARSLPSSLDWLEIEDDLQRSLLVQSLKARGDFNVVEADTLAHAESRLADVKPLIVAVRAGNGDEDISTLTLRGDMRGLLVIAPSPLAMHDDDYSSHWMSWERLTAKGRARAQHDALAYGRASSVKRWAWTPHADWRDRLLQWVENRLNRLGADTLFSAQELQTWLNTFDPHSVWFRTITDMMHLCHFAHDNPKGKLPRPSDPDAGKTLVSQMQKRPGSANHRLGELAWSRWTRRDLPWHDGLSAASWMQILDTRVAITKADLVAIAEGKTLSARTKTAEEIEAKFAARNLDTCLSDGLLREMRGDCYDFQHRTLANLTIRDALIKTMIEQPLDKWAMACFDTQRRRLIDCALSAISIDSLVDVGKRLEDCAPDSAVAIGASEALFVEISRRDRKEAARIPESLLADLTRTVLSRLQLGGWDVSEPYSRNLTKAVERLEWIDACWRWSLLAPKPAIEAPQWLFPGWSNAQEPMPLWMDSLWPNDIGKYDDTLPPEWNRLLDTLDVLFEPLTGPIEGVTDITVIGHLVKGAKGAWLAASEWWTSIIGLNWAEGALLARLAKACDADGNEAAARLWPSYVAFERKSNSDERLFRRYSRVRMWLLERLSGEQIMEGLTDDDCIYLAMDPQSLPPGARAPLLLRSLDDLRLHERVDVAGTFLKRFGPDAVPVLDSVLHHDFLGDVAAECLWRWAPAHALRLFRQCTSLETQARANLLRQCPAAYMSQAAGILLTTPSSFEPSDRSEWARRNLSISGHSGECLISILNQANAEIARSLADDA